VSERENREASLGAFRGTPVRNDGGLDESKQNGERNPGSTR
jgi:hypothetical protein